MGVTLAGSKYELEREVARGGMGSIWIAFDPNLKRRVVLKKMLWEESAPPELREQFEREAQAVARLQSPHVVQIFDYGIEPDGTPYIVMELLDGETLDERLEREARLGLPKVVELVSQIARGLAAAHAAGIVHRDLKPSNVFLSRGDGGETAKLLDFGLAFATTPAHLQGAPTPAPAELVLGTPLFMAPEQVEGVDGPRSGSARPDHRSDLWALGVICYRALTGAYPFRPAPLFDMFRSIRGDTPSPPSGLAPGLPAEVDAFFARALAKDPAERFQSARELAGALASLAEASAAARATKILVVDDEPDIVRLVQQRFRRQIAAGVFSFVFAEDGASALAQLEVHPDVDVVLSDINMPGMDGLTFLGRVGEVNPIVKVCIMSAYGDMANIRTAMNRGAFDFLIKPLNFKDLEAVIVKTAKHVRATRETFRSAQENKILRMFFGQGVADRLLPMIRATEGGGAESYAATLVSIRVCDFSRVAGRVADDVALRRLNANFAVIVPELTARGGQVDAFHDDALFATFRGEDGAMRALRACDAVIDKMRVAADRFGPESSYAAGVAIGADSGTVVCGSVGGSALGRLDYVHVGDVVKRVGRFQAAAGPQEVVVGAALHAVATGSFAHESLGTIDVTAGMPPAAAFRLGGRLAVPPAEVERSALAETVSLPSSIADADALRVSG